MASLKIILLSQAHSGPTYLAGYMLNSMFCSYHVHGDLKVREVYHSFVIDPEHQQENETQ